MLTFFSGTFAIAGLAAALGPILIHLINRRRYRVVRWAAMDFLREALEHSRKMLRLRDIFLLVLRTLCVLCFGLAMARPHFSRTTATLAPDQPVHAVIVVDNSLSMGYQKQSGTLLDEAKAKARDFVQSLPDGSWISIWPLCGAAPGFSRDAYRTKEDALDALAALRVADAEGTAAVAMDLALEACSHVTEVPSKRVVFIGDQQRCVWPTSSLRPQLEKLPEMQIVEVATGGAENSWVAEVKLRDGIADVETPATIVATIRHEGPGPRPDVQVTLTVDGADVGSRAVDLEPGQSSEVIFSHTFDVPAEPGRPAFVPIAVSIPSDRLPADDQRFLVVPVVASLPVLFIDQEGQDEDPRKNRYGETFRLRRLLAPVTSRGDPAKQLVQVRQARIEDLTRGLLEDVRLVVVAGVERPVADSVSLLREYVEGGGQLFLAAGGQFDPAAWNEEAWRQGAGILPLPLKAQPLGQLPEEAPGEIQPTYLSFESLVGEHFHLEGISREELQDLYGLPLFFKAVEVERSEDAVREMLEAESKRLAERGPGPSWLLWRSPEAAAAGRPEEEARRSAPRILGTFTNQAPFLVQRDVGRGRIIFLSTGLQSSWNTLTRTNAVLVLDRILRASLQRTIERRNFESEERLVVHVEPGERRARFLLVRPGGAEEALSMEALGADLYGVVVRNVTRRGHYRVTATREEGGGTGASGTKLWDVSLAVNGPERESELGSIDPVVLRERLGDGNYRWISPGEAIPIGGAQVSGEGIWKWLMSLVLILLFFELSVLAWPAWKSGKDARALPGKEGSS